MGGESECLVRPESRWHYHVFRLTCICFSVQGIHVRAAEREKLTVGALTSKRWSPVIVPQQAGRSVLLVAGLHAVEGSGHCWEEKRAELLF